MILLIMYFYFIILLQGAERKTRDEERRAAKRKMTATGRKKLNDDYHQPCERSEFYSMADLNKPPVLFTPAEDIDKVNLLFNCPSEGIRLPNSLPAATNPGIYFPPYSIVFPNFASHFF